MHLKGDAPMLKIDCSPIILFSKTRTVE